MSAQNLSRSDTIEYIQITEELERRENLKPKSTIVGFVDVENGHTHSLMKINGKWTKTKKKPDLFLAAKMERVLISNKRFIIILGGRGSGKSIGAVDISIIDARDNGDKTFFLREYQSSIKHSVYSLLKEEVERFDFKEFEAKHNSIDCNDKEVFAFAGLARNVDSIKSAHGFKRYAIEESQFISADSLKTLTPTARNKPNKGLPLSMSDVVRQDDEVESNVSMVFVANPGSSEDPFSKRFINPYADEIEREGFYEDDLHLIIKMNYTDNPWYADSGLDQEREWDYKNIERALYDHIWLGATNDSVENSLVMSEWFDACIDAHKRLRFDVSGSKFAAHDPSDTGPDSKGYAMRHGSVVLDVQEMKDGNANDGGHWAAGLAISQGVDQFTWDCDGMGVVLSEQMGKDFKEKNIVLSMFKGSESPDNPESIFAPAVKSPVLNQRKTKDSIRNKRAQYYMELRDRIYRTYRAVIHEEYSDPDKLISFSSEITLLSTLRSEICRMPVKTNNNGKFELYTKPEMKAKFKVKSPNLADSVMMLMRCIQPRITAPRIPKPIRPMGRR